MPDLVDPDVDLSEPAQRQELRPGHPGVLVVIAAGGAVGAAARSGLHEALPTGPGELPWSTLAVNVTGCLLIGMLMVLVRRPEGTRGTHPLLRPFVGVGLLGGYTSFSTYALDTHGLVLAGRPALAAGYLAGTAAAAVLAVAAGTWAGRALAGPPPAPAGQGPAGPAGP